MRIDEIGERDFLADIRDFVMEIDGAVLGFDEDASDIPLTESKHMVVNVDTFVGSTDWLPGMTPAQVGQKTAVMSLSDIVAKGATPSATLLSLCVPKEYDKTSAQELVRGYSQYCLKSGIPFVGGDLGITSDIVLTGVALGLAPPSGIIKRNGAKEGDILAVTGELGLTSVAYQILLSNKGAEPDLRQRAVQAAYKPTIYPRLVPALADIGAISASMDCSDGMGITLNTMATQSGTALVIDKLPVFQDVMKFARKYNIAPLKLAMQGGEEFVLALTIPNEMWNEALEVARKQRVPLNKIGHVAEGKGVMFESSEGQVGVPAKGYDSFREWGNWSE